MDRPRWTDHCDQVYRWLAAGWGFRASHHTEVLENWPLRHYDVRELFFQCCLAFCFPKGGKAIALYWDFIGYRRSRSDDFDHAICQAHIRLSFVVHDEIGLLCVLFHSLNWWWRTFHAELLLLLVGGALVSRIFLNRRFTTHIVHEMTCLFITPVSCLDARGSKVYVDGRVLGLWWNHILHSLRFYCL